MIVIDGRRDPARAAWRSWRRRLQGAISRTLSSSTPIETWSRELPTLAAAVEAAIRVQLEHEFHQRGREMKPDAYEGVRDERAKVEPLVAAAMGPKRCVQLLVHTGVAFERAMQLLEAVGPSVSSALAFADVIDVMMLDDGEQRGAA